MKKIALGGKRGQGKFALVDDQDYEFVSAFRWYLSATGYVVSSSVCVAGRQYETKLHRLLFNRPLYPDVMIDHKHGDRLDNRRSQLRICTKPQNGWNKGPRRDNKSGYKGVFWLERLQKYEAYLYKGKVKHHLGWFTDPIEAARAHNEAAIEHFGEFAWLNALPSSPQTSNRPLIHRAV